MLSESNDSVVNDVIFMLNLSYSAAFLLWVKLIRKRKKLAILHRSDNYIVINKDPDLLINSDDPKNNSTLHLFLCQEYPWLANPSLRHHFHFVHRLDYVTSGVIVVGLSKKASSAAAAAFQNRLASKYYLALLRGHVSTEMVDINVPIGDMKSEMHHSRRMTALSSADSETCYNPRLAFTRLLVLERGIFDGYPATKVLLRPITGRRHQLRVHCSYLGHTIIGDFTYSRRKDVKPQRTFLHAFRLTLPNPVERLDIQTPDPFDDVAEWTPIEKLNAVEPAFLKLQSTSDLDNKFLVRKRRRVSRTTCVIHDE